VDDFIGVDGNQSIDPEFLDYDPAGDPADWDLHLALNSPLIDAGDPSLYDPDGSDSDIGAYSGEDAGLYDSDLDGAPLWWQPGPYDPVDYPAEGWDCDDLDGAVGPGNGC
jgi:hypothetical protein